MYVVGPDVCMDPVVGDGNLEASDGKTGETSATRPAITLTPPPCWMGRRVSAQLRLLSGGGAYPPPDSLLQ